jgi:hypothetical protein
MPVFPSVEWFEAVNALVNQCPEYRKIGTADMVVGFKVADLPDEVYAVTFEAFEVTGARKISEEELRTVDFWLELPYSKWKAWLEDIKAHGKSSLDYNVNTLDLNTPGRMARTYDQYRGDLFFRLAESLQHYMDESANVETQFLPVPVA